MIPGDDKEKTVTIPVVGERHIRSVSKQPSNQNMIGTERLTDPKSQEVKRILSAVYNALTEKGYNPINQLVGYLLSEDPTYITNYKNARSLIRKVDRDELLGVLIKSYLDV